jgi:hypothetical protein
VQNQDSASGAQKWIGTHCGMMSKPANDPPLFEWLSKVVFEIAANMAKKAACECQVNWKCKTANS